MTVTAVADFAFTVFFATIKRSSPDLAGAVVQRYLATPNGWNVKEIIFVYRETLS